MAPEDTLLVGSDTFSRDHGTDAVVTALLVLPGLLIGFMARPTEHELLASFLASLRYVALMSGLVSFTAAFILFAGYPESTLEDLLWSLAGFAGFGSGTLTTSWLAGNKKSHPVQSRCLPSSHEPIRGTRRA